MTPSMTVFWAFAAGSVIGFIRIYLTGLFGNARVTPLIFLTVPFYLLPMWMAVAMPEALEGKRGELPFLGMFFALIIWFGVYRKHILPHASPFLVISTLCIATIMAVTIPVIGAQFWWLFTGLFVIAGLFLLRRRVIDWYVLFVVLDLAILFQSIVPVISDAATWIYLGVTPSLNQWLTVVTTSIMTPAIAITAAYLFTLAPGKKEGANEYRLRMMEEELQLRSHEFPFLSLAPEELLFSVGIVGAFAAGIMLFPEHRILVLNSTVLFLSAFDRLFSKVRKPAGARIILVQVMAHDPQTGRWLFIHKHTAKTDKWTGFVGPVAPGQGPDDAARSLIRTSIPAPLDLRYAGTMTLEAADEIGEADTCVALYVAYVTREPRATDTDIDRQTWQFAPDCTPRECSPMVVETVIRTSPAPAFATTVNTA